jgi:hypothetical protein
MSVRIDKATASKQKLGAWKLARHNLHERDRTPTTNKNRFLTVKDFFA